MAYVRPKSAYNLTPTEKRELLQEYFDYYREVSKDNPELLNSKLPRSAFDDVLSEIGELILSKSEELSSNDSQVSKFLAENPLPKHLEQYLPENFRAFCLALNAVKQWISAEQAATDRYIFGATVRKQCKDLSNSCLVSGKSADEATLELHHPVRDGRPPIPLAKEVHAEIEGQVSIARYNDDIMGVIKPLKKAGNRSWENLKLGCELHLGVANTSKGKNIQSSSKSFAKKASESSGLSYQELLKWVESHNLA